MIYNLSQETRQPKLPVLGSPTPPGGTSRGGFAPPGSSHHSFSQCLLAPHLQKHPVGAQRRRVCNDPTSLQMISLDGCDFTTASVSKKNSPLRQDLVQSTGKVVKSIFVPNVGWASQVTAPWGSTGLPPGTHPYHSFYRTSRVQV